MDVTCGAAVIPHVVDTAQGDNPPQINAVTADTKLITISVGGNDIDFNATALGCGDPSTVCKAPDGLDATLAALPGQLQAMSLTDGELALLRSMGEQLEATFVKVFAKSDVVFVDPYAVPGDHTACGTASERWTNGYSVPTGAGFAYHPTALGHQAMARLVEKALSG